MATAMDPQDPRAPPVACPEALPNLSINPAPSSAFLHNFLTIRVTAFSDQTKMVLCTALSRVPMSGTSGRPDMRQLAASRNPSLNWNSGQRDQIMAAVQQSSMDTTPTQSSQSTQPSQPIDPAQAQAAQIPLQDFTIPPFPAEAKHIKALTLTSDIKIDEYQDLLKKPFSIPSGDDVQTIAQTCPAIESLTLELFSLGYPAGFLSVLANDVAPDTKTLVIYSQLLAGISAESQGDAVRFFERLRGLRALHLLDVFARPGFWSRIAPFVRATRENVTPAGPARVDEKAPDSKPVTDAAPDAAPGGDEGKERKGLYALELNYTTQHTDDSFLSKVSAAELPLLISPTLISLSLNVSEADVTDDPDDPTNAALRPTDAADKSKSEEQKKREAEENVTRDGVMTFNKTSAAPLVEALTAKAYRPRALKLLNTTLYTLSLADLRKVMEAHKGLLVAGVTVEVDDPAVCRAEVLALLRQRGRSVEQLEVCVSPSLGFYMKINKIPSTALADALPTKEDLEALSKEGLALQSLKANVLKSKHLQTVDWECKGGKWVGGFKPGESQKEQEAKFAAAQKGK